MRVFVTGASGHVGAAVVPELVAAGHTVIGLARSARAAATVRALGAEVRRGDLADLDGLRLAARDADGVIHLAFQHDELLAGDLRAAASADVLAVQAIGAALRGTYKPLVGTNATVAVALAAFGGVLTEYDRLPGGPRIDTENEVIGLSAHGVRSSVVRLPPAVHSNGAFGFVSGLIDLAAAARVSGYVGDGANRWPAVDTRDAAVLYRLALESAPAGSCLHAVAEDGVPLCDIAAAVGSRVGVDVGPVEWEPAGQHFRHLGPFIGLDNPTSSRITRNVMGWAPTRPGLLADLADTSPTGRQPHRLRSVSIAEASSTLER